MYFLLMIGNFLVNKYIKKKMKTKNKRPFSLQRVKTGSDDPRILRMRGGNFSEHNREAHFERRAAEAAREWLIQWSKYE
jgi:hypothetical protein